MSVPVWERGLSKTDFVYQPYQLVIRLVEITANKPKKYGLLFCKGDERS